MPVTIPQRRQPIEQLSLAMLAGMHLSCFGVLMLPVTAKLVTLGVASYVLRMWAITAGYHRYFSHRAYKTSRPFQFVLALLGTCSMQNGPIWWASWHRHHHRYTDGPKDVHSPLQHGFWEAHMGWILSGRNDVADPTNVTDLLCFPELSLLDRHKWLPLIAYALGCYAIAGVGGVLWGFVLSSVLLLHATALINSAGHLWGSRRYETPDTSRNNLFLALLTLGEGWHNNHHHACSSARQGFFWWEVDLSYYALRLLSSVGLVWDLRMPSQRARFGAAMGQDVPRTTDRAA
jgi:stearoyl-CoA desaturase (delta-9 desaturase)